MTTAGAAPIPADLVLVRSYDTRVRNFRGKLLVARAEHAVELDEVGAYIFKSIDGSSTMAQIATRMAADYDIPYDVALADGTEFVAELAGLGIVGTQDGSAPEPGAP
jgi:hypothetical protein